MCELPGCQHQKKLIGVRIYQNWSPINEVRLEARFQINFDL